jgi:hypothetical protein
MTSPYAWAVRRAIADLEKRLNACDTAIAQIAIQGQIDALERVIEELNSKCATTSC